MNERTTNLLLNIFSTMIEVLITPSFLYFITKKENRKMKNILRYDELINRNVSGNNGRLNKESYMYGNENTNPVLYNKSGVSKSISDKKGNLNERREKKQNHKSTDYSNFYVSNITFECNPNLKQKNNSYESNGKEISIESAKMIADIHMVKTLTTKAINKVNMTIELTKYEEQNLKDYDLLALKMALKNVKITSITTKLILTSKLNKNKFEDVYEVITKFIASFSAKYSLLQKEIRVFEKNNSIICSEYEVKIILDSLINYEKMIYNLLVLLKLEACFINLVVSNIIQSGTTILL